ncbi:hypothetical protein MTO96_048124 [Rhipicephalus appendiculatus]
MASSTTSTRSSITHGAFGGGRQDVEGGRRIDLTPQHALYNDDHSNLIYRTWKEKKDAAALCGFPNRA